MTFNWENWDHYNWAYKAKQDFYESLETREVKSLYGSMKSKAVVVCVFGKSQVGKTTLILKLSGISDKHFEKVSKTLRGGSPSGAACSPTAIIYRKSESDFYCYKESEIRFDNLGDEEMCEKLKKLRSNVENGKFDQLETVEVQIPKKYFAEVDSELTVTIVDLPGYGSAVEAEHSHTEKLFKNYLPLSSLRLLIENANNVVSLENVNKNGRIVIDWQYQPEVYRIILTRSATAESVRESIRNNMKFSKESFREFYENTVKEKIKNVPKGVSVYPIEYGQSWEKAKKDDPQLFEKCNAIFDELIEDLRLDISISADPERQMTTMFNTYRAISDIKKSITNKFEDKVNELNNKKLKLNSDISKNEKLLEDKNAKRNKVKKEEIHKMDFEYKSRNISHDEETVSYLQNYLFEFYSEIEEKLDVYIHELSEKVGSSLRSTFEQKYKNLIKKKVDDVLNEIRVHLREYSSDKYWPSVSNNWENDIKTCKESCNDAIVEVKKLLNIFLEWHNSRIKKKLEKCEAEINELNSNLESLNQKVKETRNEMRDTKNESERCLQPYEEDEKKAANFKKRLGEKYSEEFKNKWERISITDTGFEAMIELIQLVVMNHAFFKLNKI